MKNILYDSPTMIGSRISLGTPNSILFIDSSSKLAQDNPGLTYDGTDLTLLGNINAGTFSGGGFSANEVLRSDGTDIIGDSSLTFNGTSLNTEIVDDDAIIRASTNNGNAVLKLRVDKGGSAGIWQFQVVSNSHTFSFIENDTYTPFLIQSTTPTDTFVMTSNSVEFNMGLNDVDSIFYGETFEIMRIDALNHRVGIGTDTPREKLEVSDNLIINGGASQAIHIGYSSTLTQFPGMWLLSDGTPDLTNYRMLMASTSTEFNNPDGGSVSFSIGGFPYIGLRGTAGTGDIRLNPDFNDIDTVFNGETSEVMRIDALNHRVGIAIDTPLNLFHVATGNRDFQIESTNGGIGIGVAPAGNTALKIVTDGRYGMTFNHTSSAVYPNTAAFTSTFSGGTQGTSFRSTVISSGSTAVTDWLTGNSILVQQRRTADMTNMETAGMSFQVLNEVNSVSAFNNGNFYGLNIEVGAGGGSYDAGIQTVPVAAGITARLIKNSKDSGTVVFTNWSAIYAPNATSWVGSGIFTVINGRGIWSEDQSDATNNTNLLLGDSGTTGNWSIYNNSAYDSLLLATNTKGYIRDTGIHIASLTDGHLDLTADVSIDMNAPVDGQDSISSYNGRDAIRYAFMMGC